MNKEKIIGLCIVIFLAGFATGMMSEKILSPTSPNNSNTEPNNQSTPQSSNISFFYGTWVASEESHNQSKPGTVYYTWTFSENKTVHTVMVAVNETINYTFIDQWLSYQVTDEILKIQAPIGGMVEYTYSFSENKQLLTLTENGDSITFTKLST